MLNANRQIIAFTQHTSWHTVGSSGRLGDGITGESTSKERSEAKEGQGSAQERIRQEIQKEEVELIIKRFYYVT